MPSDPKAIPDVRLRGHGADHHGVLAGGRLVDAGPDPCPVPKEPANPDVLHVDEATRDAMARLREWLAKSEALRRPGSTEFHEGKVLALRAVRGWLDEHVPESRFPVSAGPSPNPLREALERIAAGDVDLHIVQMFAREALATDQSQSDRTSDEATPAEPAYEWRAWNEHGESHVFQKRGNAELDAVGDIERRVKAGPWERVDDGGRRDG